MGLARRLEQDWTTRRRRLAARPNSAETRGGLSADHLESPRAEPAARPAPPPTQEEPESQPMPRLIDGSYGMRLREAEEARRAAEEAAQESLAELARAARLISVATFASSLAHEVNQPVAAIAANSEAALRWLSKDPPDLEEVRAALQRITRDAVRTSAVVGRTRGMLTKDLGRRQAVDLNPLLDEALVFAGLQPKRGSIKVETDYAADLPAVWADPVQIQQVALNLITNALDAMKGVSARKRVLKIATACSAPGEVMVSVADTGTGVDDDNLQHIFTHLFTTKPDGVGLGLPISKAIVEAHGGRLDMARNQPGGAIFRFTLRAMEPADG